MLGLSLWLVIAASPVCPAEAHPDWATANATRKRDLLRECKPSIEPAKQPEAAPERIVEAPPWSKNDRRSVQYVLGALATTVSAGGMVFGLAASEQSGRVAGLIVGAGSALLITPLVMLVGHDEPNARWAATLLGTVIGLAGTGGVTALGYFLGFSTGGIQKAQQNNALLGGLIGLMLTLPLPVIGAVVGFDAGVEAAAPPRVALVPLNGGVMAAISAQF